MGIEILTNNAYLRFFFIGLVIIGLNVIYFLDKIKNKLSTIEASIYSDLNKKYKNKTLRINEIIDIFNIFRTKMSSFGVVNYYVSLNMWSGIIILIGFLIGALLSLINPFDESSQFIAIAIIFFAGVIFCISFMILAVYFIKLRNK